MHSSSHTALTNHTWLVPHAAALLAFAEQHQQFAESLAHHIQQQTWYAPSNRVIEVTSSMYLVPTTIGQATTYAHWLVRTLHDTTTHRKTKATYSAWASHYESPKDLVLGIIGLAIIGPTLGIISKKKKKKSQLHVVIDTQQYDKLSKTAVANLVQTLSMKIVSQEIRQAGGQVYQLHPDTADWCLEEPLTKLYVLDATKIATLLTTATTERLSIAIKTNETGQPIALAISPSVQEEFVVESGATEQ